MEIFLKFLTALLSVCYIQEDYGNISGENLKLRNGTGLLRMEEMMPFRIVKYCTNKYLKPKCVEIPGGSVEVGKQADIYDCEIESHGNLHETWYAHTEGVFAMKATQIRNARSGLCLGVMGNPETDGTAVGQVTCDHAPFSSTHWAIEYGGLGGDPSLPQDSRRIRNWGGGCLSVKTESLDNNTPMVVYSCGFNYPAQLFRIKGSDYPTFYHTTT